MEPTFLDGAITDAPEKKRKVNPPLKVCGVPEHFNLPWQLGIERGIFEAHDVNVEWVTEGKGTGAMIAKLKGGEVDIIVALTEGLVTEISRGSDIRLLGTYVNSPLTWAVSTAGRTSDSYGQKKSIEDLKDGTIGVSRMLSGSHLMATVLAVERGWDPAKLKFEIKGGFESLRNGVNDGSTDAFMWETFTTKPFHDDGEVSRIGDIATPWPCFMLAARKSVVDSRLNDIQRCLAGIHKAAQVFHAELTMPATVANRYRLKAEDAQAWYSKVDIRAERFISEAALQRVISTLKTAKAIDETNKIQPADLIESRLAELKRGDIKAMKLYNRPELMTALHLRLRAANLESGPASFKDFLPYDQHHYHGTDAIDELVRKVNISNEHRVINIGSGLGGPARYMAGVIGCQVLACELQNDLHMSASELTERCGMQNKLHHVAGDFLSVGQHLQLGAYDFVVSWLTVLHIPDRTTLFKRAYDVLKPGGTFFAADFFELGRLTDSELDILKKQISCPFLPTMAAYKAELELAGFKVAEANDCTEDWKIYTANRVTSFEKDRLVLSEILGKDIYESLLHFYTVVRDLYRAGNLGGVKIYATKPLGW